MVAFHGQMGMFTRALAYIMSHGADGLRQVAPEPGGRGLLAASRMALANAGVTTSDVDGYHAHGTGTVRNDRMEATVFAGLFSGRAVTVSAIKGSVGHTLGAAGALDALRLRHAPDRRGRELRLGE